MYPFDQSESLQINTAVLLNGDPWLMLTGYLGDTPDCNLGHSLVTLSFRYLVTNPTEGDENANDFIDLARRYPLPRVFYFYTRAPPSPISMLPPPNFADLPLFEVTR